MEEAKEPLISSGDEILLEFPNCPGCVVDRRKEEKRGVPYKELAYIWLVSLCTALPQKSMFPYLYFMIRDFGIAKRVEDIGFYAGFVGSSFMLGRALTSIPWGMAADRYGRRPIILIGILSVAILNMLFGLSSNFWMAVSVRFFLGCFNSLLGSIRAYASEICREEHRALALSVVSTSRGIGLVIGPAIGGFFAQPTEKYPNLFPKNSLFSRFPYFLPCLIISVYAVATFCLCWWIPETLHKHVSKGDFHFKPMASSTGLKEDCADNDSKKEPSSSHGSLFRNRPLMTTIFAYCVFSLQEIAYSEIFSLWAVSDKKYGGLSFSSQDVGTVLAISGLGLLLFQFLVYPQVEKYLGPLVVTRLSAIVSIPLLSSFPYIAMLSGLALHLVINIATILRDALCKVNASYLQVSLITGIFILLNDAVPQHQRGAANGLSMAAMSIFKAIGPAGGGALFSWAQKHQDAAFLPGDQMVFFVLNLVQFVGLILTFKPFLALPERPHR
ncbi:putative peptide/nitrate transporter [Drosera capensis]